MTVLKSGFGTPDFDADFDAARALITAPPTASGGLSRVSLSIGLQVNQIPCTVCCAQTSLLQHPAAVQLRLRPTSQKMIIPSLNLRSRRLFSLSANEV